MSGSGEREKIYGLVGRALAHSYSVPLHRALGDEAYRLIELEPESLEEFFADERLGGVNVTIPYKKDVMALCGEISPEARAIGSVNTVVRGEDGVLRGYNTDIFGFRLMAERTGADFTAGKTVILGTGGAAVMAKYAVESAGGRAVLISRSGEDNYGNLSRHVDAVNLVNATPVGMYPGNGVSPVDLKSFPNCRCVLDLVYNPLRTALIGQAERLGIACSSGLLMLAAQALKAHELFFGKEMPEGTLEKITAPLRLESENIVIIGMPGSGKSTVGAALAAISGRTAVDTDEEIEKLAGKSIPQIFAEDGEEAFRELEREAIAEAGKLGGRIIMTGGGAVKSEKNYMPLHQNGRIYYLRRDISKLAREGRPLSENADLAAMERERAPLYEDFCDVQIKNESSPEHAAEAIWKEFCDNASRGM